MTRKELIQVSYSAIAIDLRFFKQSHQSTESPWVFNWFPFHHFYKFTYYKENSFLTIAADSDQGTEREKRNRRYGSAEGKDSEGSDYDRSKKKRKKYSEEKEEDGNLSDGERRGEREDSSSRRSKKKSRSYKKKPVSAGDYDSDTN